MVQSLLAHAAEVQKISGRVLFKPNYKFEKVDIVIDVYINGKKKGNSIKVDKSPYRFSEIVPKEKVKDSISLKIKVYAPKEYDIENSVIEYFNNIEIDLRRKQDIYVAQKAKILESIEKKNYALVSQKADSLLVRELYETESQKFNIVSMKASGLRAEKKYVEFIKYAAEISDTIKFDEINPSRTNSYLAERLDAFLLVTNYNSLKLPEKDFATIIATDTTNNLKESWIEFVKDYSKLNPNSDIKAAKFDNTTEDEILKQLQIMKSEIWK